MRKVIIVILFLLFVLSACGAPVDDPITEVPNPTETSLNIIPTPTPTEKPPVVLTVCTTVNPETLFPYGGETSA